MIDFPPVAEEEWEAAAPPKKPGKASPWDALLDALEDGKAHKVPITDASEVRGKRIAIARRARSRGYSAEIRLTPDALLVKKGDPVKAKRAKRKAHEPGTALTPDTPPRRRGRPPKKITEETSPTATHETVGEETEH